jgi:hypothetical protein
LTLGTVVKVMIEHYDDVFWIGLLE